MTPKVGRNDPCPCGSGKKFKKCCLGKDTGVRFTREDPERAFAHAVASAEAGTAVDDVPLEVQDRLVSEHYERHYRDWPDRPAPALGNRTPRQAAALARRRFKVVELLQAFENASDRRRLQGRPAYDFGWMWADLGLERPRAPTA